MTLAMFRVMLIELWRDRGALAMTFILPPLVFVIFATVFSGASGEDVRLKLAIADEVHTEASQRLVRSLLADGDLRATVVKPGTAAEVRRQVKAGVVDSGLVVRADPETPDAPLLVITDPSRAIAAPLTQAQVRQSLARALPDVMLSRTLEDTRPVTGPLTQRQQAQANAAKDDLEAYAKAGKATEGGSELFATEEISGAKRGGGNIAYYAGAVTILFALFSAMHAAMSLIDERRAGVADRILAGTAGMGPVVNGKFLFLLLQGVLQAGAIFLVAQLLYGTPVWAHFGPWLITTLAVACCAGGLALGVVALCRTRDQANMLSTFLILILAAIGGSMVPRFLMPPWLQDLGWFTPHAWAIEAYHGILWRDAPLASLYPAWGVLTGIGLAGFLLAHMLTRFVRR